MYTLNAMFCTTCTPQLRNAYPIIASHQQCLYRPHGETFNLTCGRIYLVGSEPLCLLQGAFMAALYAQGLTWEQMKAVVREYAAQMGSVSQLLSDITLPLISLFSGAGFDRVVRESLSSGPQFIEDLWLRCSSHLKYAHLTSAVVHANRFLYCTMVQKGCSRFPSPAPSSPRPIPDATYACWLHMLQVSLISL